MALGEFGKITVKASKSKPTAKRNDTWTAKARIRDADGKSRLVEATSHKSEEDARRRLQDKLTNRAAPITDRAVTKRTTLTELFELWMTSKSNPAIAGFILPQSRATYRDAWDRYGAGQLGSLRISDVDTPLLSAFLADVTARSVAQAKQLRAALSGMFVLAAENGAVDVNPVRETRRPQKPKAERIKVVESLSVDDVKLLRSAIAKYKEGAHRPGPKPAVNLLDWLDVMAATGARPNEVLAVKWSDVDLLAEIPTVTINDTVVVPKDAPPYLQGFRKDYAPPLTVGLPLFAVETLTAMFSKTGPVGLLFRDRNGGIVRLGNLRRALREAIKDSDLERVYPHLVRKTVATLIEREEGLSAASQQLGHAGPAVTAAHYVTRRTTAPDHRAVLEQLG